MPEKQLFVVRSTDGRYWCGQNLWDLQLRKAQIFTSLRYAQDVVSRYARVDPKIYPVTMTVTDTPVEFDENKNNFINERNNPNEAH